MPRRSPIKIARHMLVVPELHYAQVADAGYALTEEAEHRPDLL
jgi:hypothetical protein